MWKRAAEIFSKSIARFLNYLPLRIRRCFGIRNDLGRQAVALASRMDTSLPPWTKPQKNWEFNMYLSLTLRSHSQFHSHHTFTHAHTHAHYTHTYADTYITFTLHSPSLTALLLTLLYLARGLAHCSTFGFKRSWVSWNDVAPLHRVVDGEIS